MKKMNLVLAASIGVISLNAHAQVVDLTEGTPAYEAARQRANDLYQECRQASGSVGDCDAKRIEYQRLGAPMKAYQKLLVDQRNECQRRGKARLGMRAAQVIASCWGQPEKIHTTVTRWGTDQQWVYENYQYLYFRNGRLTGMQN